MWFDFDLPEVRITLEGDRSDKHSTFRWSKACRSRESETLGQLVMPHRAFDTFQIAQRSLGDGARCGLPRSSFEAATCPSV